jgi:hypothetical protein
MFNTIVGGGAIGAGAASRYGSGSDQKMRLRPKDTAPCSSGSATLNQWISSLEEDIGKFILKTQ